MKNKTDNNNQNFITRRNKLSVMMLPKSIAIVPANTIIYRNNDVEIDWRQDSTFAYLTGIDEADALLVISNLDNPKKTETSVFCQTKDPIKETWEGERLGCERIKTEYNINNAYELSELDTTMPVLMVDCENIYFDLGKNESFDKKIFNWIDLVKKQIRLGIQAPKAIHFLTPLIGELRLIKDEQELELMRKAAQISVEAHKQAMLFAQHQKNESQVAHFINYTMHRLGADHLAYGSIIASGKNACTLHYRKNNQNYRKGDLMLIDAGAEYQGYASDITISFPIGGSFSTNQRRIYESVLNCQQAVIKACKPKQSFDFIHQLSCRLICKELIQLGLIHGDEEKLIKEKKYNQFYMHRIGHWIGRDVHDIGNYTQNKKWRTLEEGMVLTIEPGIYITPNETIDEKFWNIGVRIEDTIVITQKGNENLTTGLPRTVDEIEDYISKDLTKKNTSN